MPRSRSRSPSPYTRRKQLSDRRDDRPRSHSARRGPPRSSSPPRRDRHRSRSPRRRREDRPRKSTGGFRWKKKGRYDDDGSERDEGRLERGYREQEPRQRSRDGGGRRDDDDDVADKKFGDEAGGKAPKKEKEKTAAPAATGEPMIVVNVNDRLGTKAAIPCLASDPISMFEGTSCMDRTWRMLTYVVQGCSKPRSRRVSDESRMRLC